MSLLCPCRTTFCERCRPTFQRFAGMGFDRDFVALPASDHVSTFRGDGIRPRRSQQRILALLAPPSSHRLSQFQQTATTACRSSLLRTVELFTFDACANMTRAPLTSTLPSQTFDRLRVLTNTLPRLTLCSPTTLHRLAVTVLSLTLAQPIPSKSNRPNGLPRAASNPTATGLKQHRRLNSPFSRLHRGGRLAPRRGHPRAPIPADHTRTKRTTTLLSNRCRARRSTGSCPPTRRRGARSSERSTRSG
jgi:hypothetical protein